jgi:hypothetical protein
MTDTLSLADTLSLRSYDSTTPLIPKPYYSNPFASPSSSNASLYGQATPTGRRSPKIKGRPTFTHHGMSSRSSFSSSVDQQEELSSRRNEEERKGKEKEKQKKRPRSNSKPMELILSKLSSTGAGGSRDRRTKEEEEAARLSWLISGTQLRKTMLTDFFLLWLCMCMCRLTIS